MLACGCLVLWPLRVASWSGFDLALSYSVRELRVNLYCGRSGSRHLSSHNPPKIPYPISPYEANRPPRQWPSFGTVVLELELLKPSPEDPLVLRVGRAIMRDPQHAPSKELPQHERTESAFEVAGVTFK